MEGGGVVQADQLAQVGEPDAFAVARDLLEDGEGATELLHADALAILGVVVDIGLRRLDQPGDGWFLNRLSFRARSHKVIPSQPNS